MISTSNLDALFHPQSIAMIGASNQRNKWGYRILSNIVLGRYEGRIFPINPSEQHICGLNVYPSILDVPEPVDMALIVVPVPAVSRVIDECLAKGVRAAILITAGFGEIGPEGRLMEAELARRARRGGMIFTGPNCNGIISTPNHLYAMMLTTFPKFAQGGSVSMVTQSGNIGLSMLTRGVQNRVGFSKYVSSGNEACLRTEELIEYFGEDPESRVILTYIEGVKDGRRLFEACRRVGPKKPILLFKSGKTKGGAGAAQSHTGSIAGSNEIFDALCRQTGVIRCGQLDEMFDLAAAFQRQPLPRGPRVGIITSGGGWGVLTSDACEARGLEVGALSAETIGELDRRLPAWWSRNNPIDLVAGTGNRYELFKDCIDLLFGRDEVDAIILSGIGSTLLEQAQEGYVLNETEKQMIAVETTLADLIADAIARYRRPIIPQTDLNAHANPAENPLFKRLNDMGIMVLPDPERAAAVLGAMHRRHRYLERLA